MSLSSDNWSRSLLDHLSIPTLYVVEPSSLCLSFVSPSLLWPSSASVVISAQFSPLKQLFFVEWQWIFAPHHAYKIPPWTILVVQVLFLLRPNCHEAHTIWFFLVHILAQHSQWCLPRKLHHKAWNTKNVKPGGEAKNPICHVPDRDPIQEALGVKPKSFLQMGQKSELWIGPDTVPKTSFCFISTRHAVLPRKWDKFPSMMLP